MSHHTNWPIIVLYLKWEEAKRKRKKEDFSGGPVVKNLCANAEHMGLIPGPRRSHMPQGNEAHESQLESSR